MLLMVQKDIRGGICHAIHGYAETNKKYMKNYDKNKDSSYLKYWDISNLYLCAISQKLVVGGFKWLKYTSQFNKNYVENCNKESDAGYFIKFDVQYPTELHPLHNDLPFFT